MKFLAALLLTACMLTGCGSQEDALEQAMTLRKDILSAESCIFEASITADYTNALYTFQVNCIADKDGALTFTVTAPDTIAGISGKISQDSAALTFDHQVLAFPLLADGSLTPVSTPWIFWNTLRSGYISGCGETPEGFCLYIDDSFQEQPLQLEVYTDRDFLPIRADILWKQRRILSADILDFHIG